MIMKDVLDLQYHHDLIEITAMPALTVEGQPNGLHISELICSYKCSMLISGLL